MLRGSLLSPLFQDIDWLPIDVAAKGIVEITRCSTIQSRYHHVALPPNVTRPSWQSFLHWLKKGGLGFEIQSKNDWLQSIIEKKDQVRGSALIDIWAGVSVSTKSVRGITILLTKF